MAAPSPPTDPAGAVPDRGPGRWTRLLVGAGLTVVAMLLVAAVHGGSDQSRAAPAVSATASTAPPAAATTTGPHQSTTTRPRSTTTTARSGGATTTAVPAPTTTDPGALPQTDTKPDTASATFVAHVNALWAAIVADDPERAMPFFFPLKAYEQVKAISDPDGDWNTRLVAAYREDIHAWHSRLGANAATATLGPVTVPDAAQWIQPGVEFNKGSYWRVYGATLGYQVDGRSGTFTVASMISWRGEWYVVHLASIR
jgi:hypothetical protein